MSTTPKTDANVFRAIIVDSAMKKHECEVVHASLARHIEEELNQALNNLEKVEGAASFALELLNDSEMLHTYKEALKEVCGTPEKAFWASWGQKLQALYAAQKSINS